MTFDTSLTIADSALSGGMRKKLQSSGINTVAVLLCTTHVRLRELSGFKQVALVTALSSELKEHYGMGLIGPGDDRRRRLVTLFGSAGGAPVIVLWTMGVISKANMSTIRKRVRVLREVSGLSTYNYYLPQRQAMVDGKKLTTFLDGQGLFQERVQGARLPIGMKKTRKDPRKKKEPKEIASAAESVEMAPEPRRRWKLGRKK